MTAFEGSFLPKYEIVVPYDCLDFGRRGNSTWEAALRRVLGVRSSRLPLTFHHLDGDKRAFFDTNQITDALRKKIEALAGYIQSVRYRDGNYRTDDY